MILLLVNAMSSGSCVTPGQLNGEKMDFLNFVWMALVLNHFLKECVK